MAMVEVLRNDIRETPSDEVRPATLDELEDVMALCRALHQEIGIFTLDEGLVRRRMELAIRGQEGTLGVIGRYREIKAMMYLVLSQYWYTREPHVAEMFSYVMPKFRHSSNAKTLIEWAKLTADGLGMRLFIGVVSTERTQAKMRLYRRQLGEPVGGFFIYGKTRTLTNGTEH